MKAFAQYVKIRPTCKHWPKLVTLGAGPKRIMIEVKHLIKNPFIALTILAN
jgi:hypothetical protein